MFVGSGGDGRVDAQKDGLARSALRRLRREPVDLVEVVDDHAADALAKGQLELLAGLVVAVERDAFAREVDPGGDLELSARDDVEPHPLLRHDPEQPRRAVRLRRVLDGRSGRVRAHRLAERASSRADRGFVVEVDRRPVAQRDIDDVAASDEKMPARPHHRGVGSDPLELREWAHARSPRSPTNTTQCGFPSDTTETAIRSPSTTIVSGAPKVARPIAAVTSPRRTPSHARSTITTPPNVRTVKWSRSVW